MWPVEHRGTTVGLSSANTGFLIFIIMVMMMMIIVAVKMKIVIIIIMVRITMITMLIDDFHVQ